MSGGFVVSGSACRASTKPNRGVLICDGSPVSGSSVRRWLRDLRRDGLRDLRRACRKDLIFVTGQPPATIRVMPAGASRSAWQRQPPLTDIYQPVLSSFSSSASRFTAGGHPGLTARSDSQSRRSRS
jgi:hypothetical protein